MEPHGLGRRTVFSRKYGIRLYVQSALNDIVQTPEWSVIDEDIRMSRNTRETMYLIRPKITSEFDDIPVMRMLREGLAKYVTGLGRESPVSDGLFLATVGAKRNWKSGCVICLSDKMMGTTCGCGHTEIVMFRPCGHSICIEPCFKKMMGRLNIPLGRRTVTYGDQTFFIGNEADVNLKFDTGDRKRFMCPTCRSPVQSTFRIETSVCDTSESNPIIEPIVGVLTERVISEL